MNKAFLAALSALFCGVKKKTGMYPKAIKQAEIQGIKRRQKQVKNGVRRTSRIKEYAAKGAKLRKTPHGNAVRTCKRYVKTGNSRDSLHIHVCHISRKSTLLSQKPNFLSMPKGIPWEVKV